MMKKTILGLALITTGIAGVAMAQTPGAMADPMGDKTVTKAEMQAKAGEMFAKMDANGDGKLDQADRAAHQTQMFDRLDTDKNGTLSRAEFDAGHQRKDGADKGPRDGKGSGDGKMGKRGGHDMMGKMADANKDGAVSKDEFMAVHTRMFDAADTDKDGKLTPAERKAHHQQMRAGTGKRDGAHAGHAGMAPPPPPAN